MLTFQQVDNCWKKTEKQTCSRIFDSKRIRCKHLLARSSDTTSTVVSKLIRRNLYNTYLISNTLFTIHAYFGVLYNMENINTISASELEDHRCYYSSANTQRLCHIIQQPCFQFSNQEELLDQIFTIILKWLIICS